MSIRKFALSILVGCVSFVTHSQASRATMFRGIAPTYIGQTIAICEIEDYLSYKETVLATATVQPDSTFKIVTEIKETQQIVLRAGRNVSNLYADPGGNYELYIPEKDRYDAYRTDGNKIELAFVSLDSTDINYKVLSFQQWMDEYVANYYYLKNVKPIEFAQRMDEFKTIAEKYYSSDPSTFLKAYIKFSVATLDNIQYAAERNRYEKHDFYLKNSPVFYRNDAYMEYFNAFYDRMIPRLEMETNNRVYLGVLKSSPTLIMRALGGELTLSNLRLRELVMIKSLAEEYYSNEFPQTNILTILDSVSKGSMFPEHTRIARNVLERLTELAQGGKAPDFALKTADGKMKTISNYKGKYLYIHFYDPSKTTNSIELAPLQKLHKAYSTDIQFVTVIPEKELENGVRTPFVQSIPWNVFEVESTNPIWKNYKVEAFPTYVLIDPNGYIVQAPALGPMPNGQYQTIDQTFFFIQQALNREKER